MANLPGNKNQSGFLVQKKAQQRKNKIEFFILLLWDLIN